MNEDEAEPIASASINPTQGTEMQMSILQCKGTIGRHERSCEHRRLSLGCQGRLCEGDLRWADF